MNMILKPVDTYQKSEPFQILQVQITVLALGESQHYGWWRSQFLSTTGLSFLNRIYPRTKFVAAVNSASRAAQQVHDTSIGKGKFSHLFRLGARLEDELDSSLKENEKELLDHFLPILNHKEKLIQDLGKLADGAPGLKKAGPILLPDNPKGQVKGIAATYLNGFQQNIPVFPYFGSEE